MTFYATGAGQWNVAYPDGSLVIAYWSRAVPGYAWPLVPLAPVAVTIGGQAAEVVEAKAQKLKVSGMLEVTARIPEGIEAGAQPVVLKVGESDSSSRP